MPLCDPGYEQCEELNQYCDKLNTEVKRLRAGLVEIAQRCEAASHPAAPVCLTKLHVEHLQQIAGKARNVLEPAR